MKTDTDELLIAALSSIGHHVWVFTNNTTGEGIDPTANEGSKFKNDVFKIRSYDWSWDAEDDGGPQPVNFKYI